MKFNERAFKEILFVVIACTVTAWFAFMAGRSYEIQLNIEGLEKENRDFKIQQLSKELMREVK